jgi:hypothetical protein
MATLFTTLRRLTISFLLIGVAWHVRAAAPDFTGKWVLDPSKSQDTRGESIEMTIQADTSGKLTYDRVIREGGGREIHANFSRAVDGSWCPFDENGHKAKVSLWYDGSALMMAKTGGLGKDATTERRFELSSDGKTLTVEFTNYSENGKAQKLVFNKQ